MKSWATGMVSGMRQLWLTPLWAIAIATTIIGCAGQNLPGRWRGPFPLDGARDCVLNLYGDHRFDLACQNRSWIGGGNYRTADDKLTFEFAVLARRDGPIHHPPTVCVDLIAHGNEVTLRGENGQEFNLRRRLER